MNNCKFVVTKSKWLRNRTLDNDVPRGYIYTGGKMLNSQGLMCCLGHCMVNLGVRPELMLEKGMPAHVVKRSGLSVKAFEPLVTLKSGYLDDTILSNEASFVNDSDVTTSEQKMEQLIALFKEYGHDLVFVD